VIHGWLERATPLRLLGAGKHHRHGNPPRSE
jgi:hypothetical protein